MVISSKRKNKAEKGSRDHLWGSGLGGKPLNRVTFERGAEDGEHEHTMQIPGEAHLRQRDSQQKA